MKPSSASLFLTLGGSLLFQACHTNSNPEPVRPNILFAISDDQSFPHTGFAGARFVNTPGFDRVAREGVYFTTCYAGSPGCAPSRSSIVTGRYHWQNEQSGQHASSWMKKYVPFIDLLDSAGYHTGYTGKGVGPFQYARNENDSLWRKENAAGRSFNQVRYNPGSENDERYSTAISNINYAANFRDFMKQRKPGQPFFFWYGASEPHRDYEEGSWQSNEKALDMVDVPRFLPDHEIIRGDILDYGVEIDWFDLHLVRMLNYLDSIGELDNTIVMVTSDNGMPFPRAKANCYEYGVRVPLAIRYPRHFPGGRMVDDLISFVDFAPTILEITSVSSKGMMPISGKSMLNVLTSGKSGLVDPTRKYIFAGRERHSSSRWDNLGYPQRVIRSSQYLLVWNMRPELWPAGDPQRLKPGSQNEVLPLYGLNESGKHESEWAFTDVDAAPAKSFLIENHKNETIRPFFGLAFGLRPEFELYDVSKDPECLNNLYGIGEFTDIGENMKKALMEKLIETGDPRVTGPDPEIFDSYIRYSPIREFPRPVWATLK